MKESSIQLIETIKILTFEFLNSVQKMCHLHKQTLLNSKHEIYTKVFALLEIQDKPSSGLQSYANLLEHSMDDQQVKKQYFEKDLSVHQSSHNHQSMERYDKNECIQNNEFENVEDLDKMLKRQKILQLQRSNETTKFYQEQNGLFNFQIFSEMKDKIDKMQNEQFENSQENQDYQYQELSNDSEYDIQNMRSPRSNTQTSKRISKNSNKKKKYRSYSQSQRIKAVNLAFNYGLETASQSMNIPKKNISRWMKRKDKNQKVRGRKPGNPSMEENLNNWIKQNIRKNRYVTQTEIRNKAKQFSLDVDFKASKGWLEKYFKRNGNINESLTNLLNKKRVKSSQVVKEQKKNKTLRASSITQSVKLQEALISFVLARH